MGRPTVLICEDEPPLRELMRAVLEPRFLVVEADDAETALDAAREARPDVVLLDVMLPGRSGLDLLRDLRSDPAIADARVAVVSAWADDARRAEAEEAGADAFLPKPFDPDELEQLVDLLAAPR